MGQIFESVMNFTTKWANKLSSLLQLFGLLLAGPVMSACILYYVHLTVFQPWVEAQQELQLQILREAIGYSHFILLIIIGALTAGLVRGFKIGIGSATAELDLVDDKDA